MSADRVVGDAVVGVAIVLAAYGAALALQAARAAQAAGERHVALTWMALSAVSMGAALVMLVRAGLFFANRA